MEYAHGFAPVFEVAPVMAEANVFNPNFPILQNLMMPCTLGLNVTSGCQSGNFDTIMRNIFGCDPYRSGTDITYDFREAANRITYTAANWVRSPSANILRYVGTYDVVLRPKYVEDMILFTPTDSYHYEKQFPNCTSWPNCTGAFTFTFIYASLNFFSFVLNLATCFGLHCLTLTFC